MKIILVLKSLLITGLNSVVSIEDPSSESIFSWISTLKSISQQSEELSESSTTAIVDISSTIIKYSNELNNPYEQSLEVLDIVDSITSVQDVVITNNTDGLSKRRLINKKLLNRKLLNNERVNDINTLLSSIGDITSNGMVVGQDGVAIIKDDFSISTSVFSTSYEQNYSFNIPPKYLKELLVHQYL
jgi:hypothetical protein